MSSINIILTLSERFRYEVSDYAGLRRPNFDKKTLTDKHFVHRKADSRRFVWRTLFSHILFFKNEKPRQIIFVGVNYQSFLSKRDARLLTHLVVFQERPNRHWRRVWLVRPSLRGPSSGVSPQQGFHEVFLHLFPRVQQKC